MDYARECLSNNLRLRRALLHLSQEDLAERSGVSAGYIANLETGRSFPSSEILLGLSQALNVPHWDLVTDHEAVRNGLTVAQLARIMDRVKDMVLKELPGNYHGNGYSSSNPTRSLDEPPDGASPDTTKLR